MIRSRTRMLAAVSAAIIFSLLVPASALAAAIPFRIEGADRYKTAVSIARDTYDPSGNGWWGTSTNVIIASGEDRAAADPLAAAGLCWAYDAPLFLVSADKVPWEVIVAIKEIYVDNGPITLHIVGGTATIPQARIDEIRAAVNPTPGQVGDRRFTTGGDRYDLSAEIAYYVDLEFRARNGFAPAVLVANGADEDKFFDALALSAISAQRGYPILLVTQDTVPAATQARYNAISPGDRVIGGGPATVDPVVEAMLPATFTYRWWGADRYKTARDIADNAVSKGLLSNTRVGVAAAMPDALTGGSAIGYGGSGAGFIGGPLLLTQSERLPWATESYLITHKASIGSCLLFGGPASITPQVEQDIGQALQ